jgi:putative endonuclease
MRVKDAVGRFGEQLAAEHLSAAGLEILDRNWRCSDGELDIVACDGSVLVFVEVKTRSTAAFGDPAEAVGRDKAARLRRLALRWLAECGAGSGRCWADLRFDVVSIIRLTGHGPSITHLRGVL